MCVCYSILLLPHHDDVNLIVDFVQSTFGKHVPYSYRIQSSLRPPQRNEWAAVALASLVLPEGQHVCARPPSEIGLVYSSHQRPET